MSTQAIQAQYDFRGTADGLLALSERVGIFTSRPVEADTELTVSYGDSFCQPMETVETPSRCLCSEGCANWIATISK